jgi:hypothetical protein
VRDEDKAAAAIGTAGDAVAAISCCGLYTANAISAYEQEAGKVYRQPIVLKASKDKEMFLFFYIFTVPRNISCTK